MSVARSVVLVSALLFGGIAGTVQAQSDKLLTATSSTEMRVSIVHSDYPVWTGGALVVVQGRTTGHPIVNVIDKNGDIVSRFNFAIPKMYLQLIYDHSVARGQDGSILMAGSAASEDAEYESFLATVAPGGTNETVVRLSPFHPDAATIAADGTIWVVGAIHPKLDEKADTDQFLIRRYDSKGDLLNSFIKWSDMTAKDGGLGPANGSQLLASKDRIAWYAPAVNSYVEFSLHGKIITQIKSWPPLGKYTMDWPVLCDDGSVIVGELQNGSPAQPSKQGIFSLNRDKGTWNFEPRNGYTRLVGCDGTSVAGFAGDQLTLTWFAAAQP